MSAPTPEQHAPTRRAPPQPAPTRPAPAARPPAALVALFAATTAVNAALLFAVEPLVTRQLLPLLGGTPAVWNTCLMAFQALLLAGYLYAHALARANGIRRACLVHLGVLAGAALTLPVAVPRATPPATWPPALWTVLALLAAVGAPFLALSAGAPLLQRWYAAAAHASGAPTATPFWLYAASNAGSLLALLAYPFLIEPQLGTLAQARAWSWAYLALVSLVGACALVAVRTAGRAPVDRPTLDAPAGPTLATDAAAIHWPDRLRWTFLAFVPSALLLGSTRYLSTDVAPVPLLWVLPLAVYLLTFVLAFAERGRVPDNLRDTAFALAAPLLAILVTLGANRPLWGIALAHLVAVGLLSLGCHQLLADRRPSAARLTEYYLWIAAGGLAGGVFDALVAPSVFDGLHEYPLAVALAAVAWWLGHVPPPAPAPRAHRAPSSAHPAARRLRARLVGPEPSARRGAQSGRHLLVVAGVLVGPVVVGALMYVAASRPPVLGPARADLPSGLLGAAAALGAFALRDRRGRFALAMAALVAGGLAGQRARTAGVLVRARGFYGAYGVRASGTYHHLQHGSTLHGAQDTRPAYRTTPLTYYHRGGPLGALFDRAPRLAAGAPPRRVAVVGLGTGTMACWGRPGERWTFYEVDPLMVRIARHPRLFTYLRDCPPRSDVVLGDARLTIAGAPRGAYDLVVLDAFSSDAIPTHLLTREAIRLYLDRLAPGGVLAVHVSNRYLDLAPIVARAAADLGATSALGRDVSGAARRNVFLSSSAWVAVARDGVALGTVVAAPGWRSLPPPAGARAWTDDYTDVLSAVRWR